MVKLYIRNYNRVLADLLASQHGTSSNTIVLNKLDTYPGVQEILK